MLRIATIMTRELVERYYNPEKLLPLCVACANYGKNYACPPTGMDMKARLLAFNYAHVLMDKVKLDGNMDKSAVIAAFTTAKERFNAILREYEALNIGSIALAPGSCMLCEKCSRASGNPCRHPDKMRVSMEAYSLEISRLAKDLFAIDIQWYVDKQPEYLTLIGAILANDMLQGNLLLKRGAR